MVQNGTVLSGNVPKWGQYPVGVFPGWNTKKKHLRIISLRVLISFKSLSTGKSDSPFFVAHRVARTGAEDMQLLFNMRRSSSMSAQRVGAFNWQNFPPQTSKQVHAYNSFPQNHSDPPKGDLCTSMFAGESEACPAIPPLLHIGCHSVTKPLQLGGIVFASPRVVLNNCRGVERMALAFFVCSTYGGKKEKVPKINRSASS